MFSPLPTISASGPAGLGGLQLEVGWCVGARIDCGWRLSRCFVSRGRLRWRLCCTHQVHPWKDEPSLLDIHQHDSDIYFENLYALVGLLISSHSAYISKSHPD